MAALTDFSASSQLWGQIRKAGTQAHYDVQRLPPQAASSAFYAALLAQDNMEIARQDADFNAILLEDAKKRHAGGIAPPSEVLNFELQVGKARVDYIASERSWQSAIVVLAALLATSEDQIWRKVELVPLRRSYCDTRFHCLSSWLMPCVSVPTC